MEIKNYDLFTFHRFFPAEYNPSYCEYVSIPDPKTCIEIIERWQRAKSPIRFAVTGALGGSINYAATIRTFNYEERAGSPGDWYYDLELREYRFITIRTIATTATATSAVTSATSESERPSTWEPPSSYTVKSGDSLWKISAEVYKDGGVGWSKIYDANVGVIGKDPNLIYPGQVLTIPG